jgi:hypothetical protein
MDNETKGTSKEETKDNTQTKKVEPVYLDAFNARTQQVEPHVLTINKNKEYVLTSKGGDFLKFSTDLSNEQLLKKLEEHRKASEGQVLEDADEVEAENQEKLDSFRDLQD